MDDLPARLRQGVIRQDAIYSTKWFPEPDVPATEAMMADAADTIEGHQRVMVEIKSDAISSRIAAVQKSGLRGFEPHHPPAENTTCGGDDGIK